MAAAPSIHPCRCGHAPIAAAPAPAAARSPRHLRTRHSRIPVRRPSSPSQSARTAGDAPRSTQYANQPPRMEARIGQIRDCITHGCVITDDLMNIYLVCHTLVCVLRIHVPQSRTGPPLAGWRLPPPPDENIPPRPDRRRSEHTPPTTTAPPRCITASSTEQRREQCPSTRTPLTLQSPSPRRDDREHRRPAAARPQKPSELSAQAAAGPRGAPHSAPQCGQETARDGSQTEPDEPSDVIAPRGGSARENTLLLVAPTGCENGPARIRTEDQAIMSRLL